MLLRGLMALVVFAGCAPAISYRYTPGVPSKARGTIELGPRATVGDLEAAVRGALPGTAGCFLWFDPGQGWIQPRFMVVSGELRLTALADCDNRLVGRDGVMRGIVLARDETSGRFVWCRDGSIISLNTRSTIDELQREIKRLRAGAQDIALATWATDDAHWALAIVERFRAAGIPLVLANEGQRPSGSPEWQHGCVPHEDGI